MNRFFCFAIFLLISFYSKADCSSTGVWIHPEKKEISSNNIFILGVYGNSQSIIDSIQAGNTAYLVSKNHKVELKILEVNIGQFRISQVVLKPTEDLLKGETYTFTLKNSEKLEQWNSTSSRYESFSWTVTQDKDLTAPKWIEIPQYSVGDVTPFGCGPAIYSIFNYKYDDFSPVYIRTELIELEGNISTSYLLAGSENGTLKVGHGMCSGAFDYKEKKHYKIRFSLVDGSGNSTNEWTDWIKLKNPYAIN